MDILVRRDFWDVVVGQECLTYGQVSTCEKRFSVRKVCLTLTAGMKIGLARPKSVECPYQSLAWCNNGVNNNSNVSRNSRLIEFSQEFYPQPRNGVKVLAFLQGLALPLQLSD